MKHIAILLVEDSPEKANAVERALTAIEGVSSGNITVAQDLVGAKRCLSEQQFDVAIIDIQIPIRFGNGPDPIGGVKLLQEIDQNATLRRPKYIIGLTQFAESVVQAGESFGERVFGIIHYSIESSGWMNRPGFRGGHLN